jgi:hypothetical protein
MGFFGSFGSWRYSMLAIGIIEVCVGLWALVFVGNRCAVAVPARKNAIKVPYQIGSDIV